MPARTEGKIKAYSQDVNAGIIASEDGAVYLFSRKDWIPKESPFDGADVTFIIEGNTARVIVPKDDL